MTGTSALVEINDLLTALGLSGTQGGHFLPLTKKQQQQLEKQARKLRKAQESAYEDRAIHAYHIAAEMREAMHPSTKQKI